VYCAIEPRELLRLGWSKKDKEARLAPSSVARAVAAAHPSRYGTARL
jgi:hypothetical protein